MSLNYRLAAYFKSRPNVWVDGRDLATVAGAYAWRSRCSELRTQRGMTIENRCRTVRKHAHNCPAIQAWDIPEACGCDRSQRFTISEYRYVPPTDPKQLPLSDQWSVGA